ncbi:hypothetical protein [Microbacterium resistens]|uniref:hypothetical protein n=1 Tax=Microbacterium resistens TaxID=156977 RepID=UPI00366C4FD1
MLIVVISPVVLIIAAIPTMGQGGDLKNTAILTSLVGGATVLVLAIAARLIWRSTPSARRRVPVIALIAAAIITTISAALMWISGH